MAADWIMLRTDLHDDPSVIGIAHGLGISENEVVGALARVWTWANEQTETGVLPFVPHLGPVDERARLPGLAVEMIRVGWLKHEDESLIFPNYDHWNSENAKSRAGYALYKRLKRKGLRDSSGCYQQPGSSSKCTPKREHKCTPIRVPNVIQDVPPNGTLTEERRENREEKKKPPLPPKGSVVLIPVSLDTPEFKEAWAAWAEDRRVRRKPLTPRAQKLQLAKLEPWGVKLAIKSIDQSIERGWQGLFDPRDNGQSGSPKREKSFEERVRENEELLKDVTPI